MFNLLEDPGEQNDLKNAHADVFEDLKALYADWKSEVLEPIPLPHQR